MSKSRIAVAVFIAFLAVSTASIFIRLAQKDAPSLVIAAIRLTIASTILLPPAFSSSANRDQLKNLSTRDWFLAALSGLFLAIHFASWITSLEFTTVVASVVLVSTGPLWVALLSPFFLKEVPSRWVWMGMALALAGGALVGVSDSCTVNGLSIACPPLSDLLAGSAIYGNFLALFGALTVAGYLMIGRRLRAKLDLVPYIFVVYSAAAIALIAFMFISGETPLGYQKWTYFWILALALIPQLIGHSTYNWVLKYLPASSVAVITLAEPFGAAILALIFLGEVPTLGVMAGGLLILCGVYLAMRNSEVVA